jgi:hypothetical protein
MPNENITTLSQWNASLKEIETYDSTTSRYMDVVALRHDDENEPRHPMLDRIAAGEVPSACRTEFEFEDDHEDCYIMSFTYPDVTYIASFWWVGRRFDADIERAIDKDNFLTHMAVEFGIDERVNQF